MENTKIAAEAEAEKPKAGVNPFSAFLRGCFKLVRLDGLYDKNEAIVLYIFFGGLTTLVSLLSQYAAAAVLGEEGKLAITTATVISWICAVTFAYVTNRRYVFDSHVTGARAIIAEMIKFYGGRAMTLLLEIVIMNVFVDMLGFNYALVKFLAQFAILILNYIISKLIVFRKKKS